MSVLTYKFISRTNTREIDQTMRKLWLLGMHDNDYLHYNLSTWWHTSDGINDLTNKFDIVIGYADGAIVGVILHTASESTIDTYVIPSFRQRGVASGMVKALRSVVGDTKVLSSWSGIDSTNWKPFYTKNHICYLGFDLTEEDISKYDGDRHKAWVAKVKSTKLKISAAYRKAKAHANS